MDAEEWGRVLSQIPDGWTLNEEEDTLTDSDGSVVLVMYLGDKEMFRALVVDAIKLYYDAPYPGIPDSREN